MKWLLAGLAAPVVLVGLGSVQADTTDGLAGYWKMDGDFQDSSSKGNHGVGNGGVGFASGRFGQAGSFDGTDDFVDVADHPTLNATDAITVTAWFKAGSFDYGSYSWPSIVKKSDGSQTHGYCLEVQRVRERDPSIGFSAYLDGGPGWGGPPIMPILEDKWYFVAGVYEASTSTFRLYLGHDDQPLDVQSSNDFFGNIVSASLNLNIGRDPSNPGSARSFDGLIDEVRIYDRALSESEIDEVYAIPEPSTLALLSMGALAVTIGWLRRRGKG